MKQKKRPYWITYGLIFIVAAVFALLFIPRKKQSTIRIGVFTTEVNSSEELDSIVNYLDRYPFLQHRIIDLGDKNTQLPELKKIDVLWYHQLDTGRIPKSLNNKRINGFLKNYIEQGGNILLTMDGLKYIKDLGLEQKALSATKVEAKDHGYGRKRGLHAYKHHPVFNNLHGGAYIFSPKKDTTARQIGFMEEEVPGNGNIIAVDWAYINMMENNKLMVEYESGKGKVIGIGAYTVFHMPNYHKIQLETFMNNVFGYLSGIVDGKKYFWDYSQNEVTKLDIKTKSVDLPDPEKWKDQKWKLKFEHQPADNFWDVAGERMVFMGAENKGASFYGPQGLSNRVQNKENRQHPVAVRNH